VTPLLQQNKNQNMRFKRIVALLFLMIVLIYSNSIDAAWHLDGRSNILDNKGLHITNLKPESLLRTFFTATESGGSISNRLYRPIPCLTLALNGYFGRDAVFGYHLVNILIQMFIAARNISLPAWRPVCARSTPFKPRRLPILFSE
jgi:hypothetical protein